MPVNKFRNHCRIVSWFLSCSLFLCFLFFYSCSQADNVRLNNDKKVRLIFTGDVLLDRGVRKQIEKRGADSVFSGVLGLFQKADFTIINLECPVTKSYTPVMKKYIFRAEPKWLPELYNAGITHCVLANNHSYDQGRNGLIETAGELIKNNLIPVGFGENLREACKPVILQKNNIKIALFSSVLLPLENWMFLEEKPCPCQYTTEQLTEAVKLYKSKNPGCFIVVILHWGVEYRQVVLPIQSEQAENLIDAGADAIIGHHPHVVQQIDFIDKKPVFFSLGNFVFDQSKPLQNQAIAVELAFSRSKLENIILHPVKINRCFPEIMNVSEQKDFWSVINSISPNLNIQSNIEGYWEIFP